MKKNAEKSLDEVDKEFKVPSAGRFMSIVILALFSSIIIAALFASNFNLGGANTGTAGITGLAIDPIVPQVPQVSYDSLRDKPPTFTNIRATVYFSASYDDYKNWCSPTKGSCFASEDEIKNYYNPGGAGTVSTCLAKSNGYCCIPTKDRGFYEDVKCEGSGVYNGRVYSYAAIGTQQGQGSPLPDTFKSGRTSTGTDPTPKRTIAVNPTRGRCYIPYGTPVYLYFGENNAWNGVYIAEDTGKAIVAGDCRIDIYTGVGQQSAQDALKEMGTEYPKVYLLTKDGEYDYTYTPSSLSPGGGPSTTPARVSQVGVYSVPYTYQYSVKDYAKLYEKSFSFAQDVLTQCYDLAYGQKDACLKGVIDSHKELKIDVDNCTADGSSDMQAKDIKPELKYISVEGTVTAKSPVQGSGDEQQSSITINDGTGDIQVFIKGYAATIANMISVGQHVLARNAVIEKDQRAIRDPAGIVIEPSHYKLDALKQFALSLADCSTADQQECKCELSYNGSEMLYFKKGKVSISTFTDKDTVQISNSILQQDLTQASQIAASTQTDFSHNFSASPTKERIFFKKDASNITILYYDESLGSNLTACLPKNKYVAFCTEIAQDIAVRAENPSGRQDTLEPYKDTLRFSLKI